jgi:uncharacterized protein (TIGR03067 family)
VRTPALLLLAASLALTVQAAPAPLPRPDASKAELKRLQGNWAPVSATLEGRPRVAEHAVVIAGDRFTYLAGTLRQDWALTLDVRGRPKILDAKCISAPFAGLVYQGIYRLDGDVLTICSIQSKRAADRPKDFTGKGPRQLVEVFRRVPSLP